MNKRFLTVITIVSLVGFWLIMGSCKVSGATGGGLSGTPLSPVASGTSITVSSLTNYAPKVMSAIAGGNLLNDMQSSSNDYVGQLGLSFSPATGMDLWAAGRTGGGSNAWNIPWFFNQGIVQLGTTYSMPSGYPQGLQVYLNGNAQDSTRSTDQLRRNGSYLFIRNQNPFTDGNGISLPLYTTNSAGAGTAVLTNADNIPVYIKDPFGLTILTIPYEFPEGETNQAGSYVLITGTTTDIPFYISANAQLPSEAGGVVNYSQHGFMGTDSRYMNDHSKPLGMHFPYWRPFVWSITNAGWLDALFIDELNGHCSVYSNFNVGGNIVNFTNRGAKVSIGFNGDTSKAAGLFCFTNAIFTWPAGAGGVWSFDSYQAYRFGIMQQSGQYPRMVHAAGSPFNIARSDNGDIQTTIGSQTLTDELSIDSSGGVTLSSLTASLPIYTDSAKKLVSGNAPVTSYASGTAYTLTATPAQLTFGTTSPSITLATAGTYLITGTAGVKYAAATYAGAQTITLKLRRTNNTAADLANGSRAVELPVLTTFTGGDVMSTPQIVYAATAGDIVQLFGSVSATPSAGSVQTDSAEIVAVRLY